MNLDNLEGLVDSRLLKILADLQKDNKHPGENAAAIQVCDALHQVFLNIGEVDKVDQLQGTSVYLLSQLALTSIQQSQEIVVLRAAVSKLLEMNALTVVEVPATLTKTVVVPTNNDELAEASKRCAGDLLDS